MTCHAVSLTGFSCCIFLLYSLTIASESPYFDFSFVAPRLVLIFFVSASGPFHLILPSSPTIIYWSLPENKMQEQRHHLEGRRIRASNISITIWRMTEGTRRTWGSTLTAGCWYTTRERKYHTMFFSIVCCLEGAHCIRISPCPFNLCCNRHENLFFDSRGKSFILHASKWFDPLVLFLEMHYIVLYSNNYQTWFPSCFSGNSSKLKENKGGD